MNVGVIGSGEVAKALASGFAKHGYGVTIGSRTPGKLTEWAAGVSGVRTGSFAEAAEFGEVVVLAVKGHVAAEALRLAGVANLKGKPVLDACNPIEEAPPVNGVLKLYTKMDESLMEQLQREFAEAKFVKAFNSVGAALMVDPQLKGGKPTMFICGNDDGAKKAATKILDDFGWETADVGKVESARAIEPLCMLWCLPGFLHNDWMHAFKVLHQ
ncbi:MAG: NAD(P)-binding domain-containing protein [Acidobacteriaceae bacterium]